METEQKVEELVRFSPERGADPGVQRDTLYNQVRELGVVTVADRMSEAFGRGDFEA